MIFYIFVIILIIPDFIFADSQFYEDDLYISGSKSFRIRKSKVSGSNSKFLTDYKEWPLKFKLEQSLQLNIEGKIGNDATISAYLDDSDFDQQDKFLTLNLKGPAYRLTLGDFKVNFSDNPYTVFNKKVKGVEVEFYPLKNSSLYLLYTRSQGKAITKLFKGKGNVKEYRLDSDKLPIIENSEIVKIGHHVLKKGEDYIIDYDSGSIFIKTHLLPIESNTIVSVIYEYEAGSTGYKRNLFGMRYKLKWDSNNKLFIDFLGLKDDKDKRITGMALEDMKIPPISHYILSGKLDYYFNRDSVFLEWARCLKDNDLTDSIIKNDSESKSEVRKGIFKHKEKLYNFEVSKLKMDPDFEIIGKKDDFRYHELTSYNLDFSPKLRLSPSYSYQNGKKMIFQDPELGINTTNEAVITNNTNINRGIVYSFNNANIQISQKVNKVDNILKRIDLDDTTSNIKLTFNKNKLNINVGYEKRDYIQNLNTAQTYNLKKNYSSIGYDFKKRNSLNFSISRQKKFRYNSAIDTINTSGINLNTYINRTLKGNIAYKLRIAEDYLKNKKNSSCSIESRFNYRPNNKTSGYVKYVHENLVDINNENGNYIEKPMVSKDFSFNFRNSFFSNINNNLFFNYKLKKYKDTLLIGNKLYNIRNKIDFHYKNHTFSYIANYIKRYKNKDSLVENIKFNNQLTWYIAVSSSYSTGFKVDFNKYNDKIDDSNDLFTKKYKWEWDKFFNKRLSFNISTGFDIINKKNINKKERHQTISSGLKYMPFENWNINWIFEKETIKKDSLKEKFLTRLQLNGRITDDADLNSYIDWVKSISENNLDYRAMMFNMEVVFRF